VLTNTVKLGYSNISLSDNLAMASDTLLYQFISYKACVFVPRLHYTLSCLMTFLLIGSNLWFPKSGPFRECN